VQQEPFLFNDSIYRNVEHGLVGTEWEDAPLETKKELVKQACTEAFADEFIERLPDVCDCRGPGYLDMQAGEFTDLSSRDTRLWLVSLASS
jgi:ABC-type multidrug transport system fused ATPase/permease subunit